MVDGVWWHGHPDHLPGPRHSQYWHDKIARNVARDRKINDALSEQGWDVIRLWDLDILGKPDSAVRSVAERLAARGWPGRSYQFHDRARFSGGA
jgi:DNA mismatch endonuclease (patch repair protein)